MSARGTVRALVCLGASLGGCALDLGVSDQCEVHDDCLEGRFCVDNRCVNPSDVCEVPACALYSVAPALARAGDTVELEGIFGPTVEVRFPGVDGGVPATSHSGHRAQVTVPPEAGTGDVMVMTGGQALGPLPLRRVAFEPAIVDVRPEQTNAARTRATLREPRTRLAVAQTASFAFAIGGEDASGLLLDTVESAVLNADGTLGTFRYSASLKKKRAGAVAVMAGPWLFVAGGTDENGAALATVERAQVLPGGTLGAFDLVAGASLITPRSDAAAALVGNRLVIVGGRDAAGAARDSVESAAIDGTGALGAFSAEPSLEDARARAAAIAAGGALWVIGGENARGPLATVERGDLRDARIAGFRRAGTIIPARAGASAVRAGREVFLVGGAADGVPSDAIERATPGETLDFIPAGSLRVARSDGALVVHENGLVAIGGRSPAGVIPTVEILPLDARAVLGTFIANDDSLMEEREGGPPVALGRTVYLVGGFAKSVTNEVLGAAVDPGGALHPFRPLSPQLKSNRGRSSLAVIGSSLYVIGGVLPFENATRSVERSELGPDGRPIGFDYATPMGTERYFANAAVLGDYLWVFGGVSTGAVALKSIERARIRGDSLDPFEPAGVDLSFERFGAAQVVDGDTVYLAGGQTRGGTILNDVQSIHWDGSTLTMKVLPTMWMERRLKPGSIVVGATWYVVGGFTNLYNNLPKDSPLDLIDYVRIPADGALSTFASHPSTLITQRFSPATIVLGSWAYAVGGMKGLMALASIERAPFVPAADGL